MAHRCVWPAHFEIGDPDQFQFGANTYLIQDENGQPLTQCALRSRFDKTRTLAEVDFQFREIRAIDPAL